MPCIMRGPSDLVCPRDGGGVGSNQGLERILSDLDGPWRASMIGKADEDDFVILDGTLIADTTRWLRPTTCRSRLARTTGPSARTAW